MSHPPCSLQLPRKSLAVLHMLAFLTSLAHAAGETSRPCDDSGMCSLGISKFWTGDIGPSANLRAMLEAVSFEKELIITTMTVASEHKWIDLPIQMHWELQQMGFGHFVVMATAKEACTVLHNYAPTASCVWDDTPLEYWGGGLATSSRFAWYLRWKLFARAGRMGYNLMSVDSDFIFFRDPYKYIRTGPMSQVQMWCNPEGGGPLHCNGGFTYIHNLRPNGPISWIFKNLVDEQMWMLDDRHAFIKSTGGDPHCHTFDQEMVFDGVKSALVGRPLILDSIQECRGEKWRIKNRFGAEIGRTEVLNNIRAMYDEKSVRNETHFPLPKDWTISNYPKDDELTKVLVNTLTVPNMAYGWPEELGGKIGPEPRGNYTAQWLATLKSDCPDCPWWNDNRPLKNGKDELEVALGPKLDGNGGKYVPELFWDKDVPTEMLAVGPAWLSNSMLGNRIGMWAGRNLSMPTSYAMTHVHYWPDAPGSGQHKTMVRKLTGRYNWSIADALYRPKHIPYICEHEVYRVLALHPSVDLRRLRSMEEYHRVVLGLIQVAHMTHRTALIPDVPCEAPWLHGNIQQPGLRCQVPLPLSINGERYSYPSKLPYPTDEYGDLVGGWFRRLLTRFSSRHTHMLSSDAAAGNGRPLDGFLYATDDSAGAAALNQQSATAQWYQPQAETLQNPSHGRSRQRGRNLRGYSKSPKEQQIFWDNQKRFQYSMSYLWADSCMRNIGKPYAILRPEFAYWLTRPEAAGAQVKPSEANTILTLHPTTTANTSPIALKPLTNDPGPGVVLVPETWPGWSVADVQALVPLGQLVQTASRFADQPLLYIGHPVALVTSSVRHAKGDQHDHGRAARDATTPHSRRQHQRRMAEASTATTHHHGSHGAERRLGEGQEHAAEHVISRETLDKRLEEINRLLQTSSCKLTQADWRDTSQHVSLNFDKAHLSLVVNATLVPFRTTPTQAVPVITQGFGNFMLGSHENG